VFQRINLKVGTEKGGKARGKGEERDAESSNARPLLKLKNALYHSEHVLHLFWKYNAAFSCHVCQKLSELKYFS
jgi:hypothetical protein